MIIWLIKIINYFYNTKILIYLFYDYHSFVVLQIECIHSGLNAILSDAMYKTPREILRFIEVVLSRLIPATNYIMLDVKYRIISYFGRVPELKWKGKMYIIFSINIIVNITILLAFLIIFILHNICVRHNMKCNLYHYRSHGCRT